MKLISEKTYHLLFWVSIVIKGMISVGELILGTALYFWDYGTLIKAATLITGDEFAEAPRDPFWNYLIHGLNGFTNTPQRVWAFIFLSHGIIKTILAVGILKDIRWIYPAAAVVFGIFAIYQCYQYIYAPSFLLIAITVFDIVLIGLIMHEYRHKMKVAS